MPFLLFALIVGFQVSVPVNAGTYQGRGSKPDTSYVVYIPQKLDLKKRHPWILAFSPDGN